MKHRLIRSILWLAIILGSTVDAHAQGQCEGVLLNQSSQLSDTLPPSSPPVYASGRSVEGTADQTVTLLGDAEIRRIDTLIRAQRLRYLEIEDEVQAQGDVWINRQGSVFKGPSLQYKLGTDEGVFEQPDYSLLPRSRRTRDSAGISLPRGFRANGSAQQANFEGPDQVRLKDGTYTTCAQNNRIWFLKAADLLLDGVTDTGYGRGVSLVFGDVETPPVPVVTFPLNDERRSGFLPPTVGLTSRSGFEYQQPYYWNLAPNYDLLLSPKLMTKRGIHLGSHFRYLGHQWVGETRAEVLPSDRESRQSRWAIQSLHRQVFGGGTQLLWNLSSVSDDSYFADFGQSLAVSSQRQLAKDFVLTGPLPSGWTWNMRMLDWQLLQDTSSPLLRAYAIQPSMGLKQVRYDVSGFDTQWAFETTRFAHPTLDGGTRVVASGQVAYPLVSSGAFLIPKIALHGTQYQRERVGSEVSTFERYGVNSGVYTNNTGLEGSASYDRWMPTLSLDTGLIFERETEFGSNAAIQTLEPRLFYVRTPYRDQSALPVFDSGSADFNFAQLFATNAFVGHDRISDANQLTSALTTRWLDASSGEEWLRLSAGQRHYFSTQRVTLPGGAASTDRSSDLLLGVNGRLTSSVTLDATLQYGFESNHAKRAVATMRFQPASGKALALSYRYSRDTLDQVDLAWQWPLSSTLYGVGRLNHSLLRRADAASVDLSPEGLVDTLLGLEYNGGCYVVRTVFQRFATAGNERATSFFLQLELNGLGRLGTNPLDALKRNIPGYRLINQPGPMPSRFEDYE